MGGNSSFGAPVFRGWAGNMPNMIANRQNQGFASPFARAFGWGGSQDSRDHFEQQLQNRAAQGNPMATYLLQARDVVGSQIPESQALGAEIMGKARSGYNAYEQSVNDFMAQLPGFQSQLGDTRAQAGLDFQTGRDTMGGAATTLSGADSLLGQAGRQLDTAQGYGERSAAEAFSPLQGRALFQEAAQRATQALGGQQAQAGLVGQGAGGAAQQDMLTNMAMQAMQNEGANQQAATGLLGELAGQRGQLGTAQTALGATQGNLGAAQGQLGAQAADTMGSLTGLGAQIAQMGPEAMGMLNQALPQLFNSLIQGQQLPLQTTGMIQQFLAGQFQPSSDLLQQTAPQMGQRTKGGGGGVFSG